MSAPDKSDFKTGNQNQQKDISHEELLKKIVAQNAAIIAEHTDIKKLLDKLSNIALHSGTSPQTSVNYYNKDAQTISVAGPNPPAGTNYNPNDPVYGNQELVYDSLQPHRRAPRIQIINDATDKITDKTIYVISSSNGSDWTPEATIRIGEARSFFNVWELRLRSPTAGTPYRVTEWDIWLPYSLSIGLAPIQQALLQNVALPGIRVNWLGVNLIPIQTPTMFRLMVAVSIAGVLSATITNGGVAQTVSFNNGIALVPGTLNMFNLLVHSGDTVNFSYSTTVGFIQIFRVQEVDSGVT